MAKPLKSTKQAIDQCCTTGAQCSGSQCAGSGVIYGLGVIGAAIYYIQQATGFWNGVLGLLKALVWPAFLVYKLLVM